VSQSKHFDIFLIFFPIDIFLINFIILPSQLKFSNQFYTVKMF